MSEVVNWGILGYARIAKNSIIPAIDRADNARVYGVASRNKAELPTGEWPQSYDDYAALLADDAIQAVYIPLPNSLHKEWVIRALEAGKHVLCEKPIGLTAAEAREMQQVAARHDRLLMEAFMYQYTDRVRVIKEVIDSGDLGAIRHINVSFRFLLDRPNTIKMQPALAAGRCMTLAVIRSTLSAWSPGVCRYNVKRCAKRRMASIPTFRPCCNMMMA